VQVAIALGVVVIVGFVGSVFRRRGTREAQSVSGYRQTLDVLGHLGGAERGVRRQAPPGADIARPRLYERQRSAEPVNFDDLGTEIRRRNTAALGEAPSRRDRSLHAMERPARRLGAPLAALVLVLAAGGAAAYMVVRSHHVTPPPKQNASTHSHRHSPPATTLPARYTAVSSTGSSAVYAPATPTYSLTIGATTADCWMSVTTAAGTTVLAQTFAAGASTSVSLTGHATIVIGAPRAAKMSIGGVPLVLPAGASGPFTVTLAPS
jgi:hypothetical protein